MRRDLWQSVIDAISASAIDCGRSRLIQRDERVHKKVRLLLMIFYRLFGGLRNGSFRHLQSTSRNSLFSRVLRFTPCLFQLSSNCATVRAFTLYWIEDGS